MDRKIGIGGSDAAAAIGLSPFKSAAQLYYEKAGIVEPDNLDDVERVIWGNLLEDTVCREYARRTDRKIRRVNRRLQHKQYPFMNCHVDRDVLNEDGILEAKTTNQWYHKTDEWGDPGTDQVPTHILLQAQHNMAVCGSALSRPVNWCDVPVLVSGQDFVVYHIKRDDDLIYEIIKGEADFWDHVVKRSPVALDFTHARAMELVKKLHPDVDGIIHLDETAQALHDRRTEVMAEQNRLKKEKAAIDAELFSMIGSAEEAYLPGGGGYARKPVQRKGYSVEPTEYIDCRFKSSLKVRAEAA